MDNPELYCVDCGELAEICSCPESEYDEWYEGADEEFFLFDDEDVNFL